MMKRALARLGEVVLLLMILVVGVLSHPLN